MSDGPDPWSSALLALDVFAADPLGTGGLWLRARPGPARDAFLARLRECLDPVRVHPGMDVGAIFGGPDITASLAAGRLVHRAGLVGEGRVVLLSMAERTPPEIAARLGQAIDAGRAAIVAVDEGVGPDEGLAPGLADRLGLFAALDGVGPPWDMPPRPNRRSGGAVAASGDPSARLTRIAAELGILSLRAPLLAIRAARAIAALDGRDRVSDPDIPAAAGLVFAHRAQALDEAEAAPEPPEPPPGETERDPSETGEGGEMPDELLVEAVRAMLPPGLAATLPGAVAKGARGAGSGAPLKGNRRGRPLPPRGGRHGGDARIDAVATLAAAAPWQRLRGRSCGRPIAILPSDLRYARYESYSDRLLVFAVDASGSAAMSRLAEAKGAIELLLGDAYASRDHVALIAFRGTTAELMLEPTRALTRAKRQIGALPGGGGTPLGAALDRALEVCRTGRSRGLDARLVLLTDGRANVSSDGTTGRAAAMDDAERAARLVRAARIGGVVLDAGRRPNPELAGLAATLGMPCHFLPRADAAGMRRAAAGALADAG